MSSATTTATPTPTLDSETSTTTTSTATPSNATHENISDLCRLVGEVFSKFSLLLRDLQISDQRASSTNDQEQPMVGWDEQCVSMFRQAVQTFAHSMREISTAVAEKRIRER